MAKFMVSCRCSLWYIHWISERLRGEYHWSGCEWRGIAVTMTFSGSNSLLQCYMYNQFVCVYCWWFHMLLLLIRYWLSDVYLLSLFITLWFIYNYNFMSICILTCIHIQLYIYTHIHMYVYKNMNMTPLFTVILMW